MNAAPVFARYLKVGDRIIRDGGQATILELHHTPADKAPGRPFGLVSGWTTDPYLGDDYRRGWVKPADELVTRLDPEYVHTGFEVGAL